MQREIQLSAVVSPSVKQILDRHVRATGVKKAHLIQEALLHHLAALDALPGDLVIPVRIAVSAKSAAAIAERSGGTPKPGKKLRKLLKQRELKSGA